MSSNRIECLTFPLDVVSIKVYVVIFKSNATTSSNFSVVSPGPIVLTL